MPKKPVTFNLRAWLDQHELTTQQLTDYLNGLGFTLSRRTVEGWLTNRLGPPAWLPPMLAQRDALNGLYETFGHLHDSVIRAGGAVVIRPSVKDLKEALSDAGNYCDDLERLFAEYLTERERGEGEE